MTDPAPLRIVHTEASLGWGGQEIRVLEEAAGMLGRGHRVTLLCPREARIHAEAAARGVPAVLDLGFTTKAHRDKFRELGKAAGLSVAVHFVDVPADERWRRVEQRNAQQGETYSLKVDRGMFDFMEGLWEPPSEAEWLAGGGLRIGADG